MTAKVGRPIPHVVPPQVNLKSAKEQSLGYKVAFVAGCIIGTPFVIAHDVAKASWEGIKWTAAKVSDIVTPLCQKVISYVHQVAKELFNWTYDNVVVPLGKTLHHVAVWTYDTVLEPAAILLFERLPKIVYDHVITPTYDLVKRVSIWTYNEIITPLLPTIRKVAELLFIDIPAWVRKNVTQPIADACMKAASWSYDTLITPARIVVHNVAQAIFITFPQMVYDTVLEPMGQALYKGSLWAYDNVVTPTVNAIVNVATQIIEPVKNGLIFMHQHAHKHIITPLATQVYAGAVWTYNAVVLPVAQRVADIAYDVVITSQEIVQDYVVNPIKTGAYVAKEAAFTVATDVVTTLNQLFSTLYRVAPA